MRTTVPTAIAITCASAACAPVEQNREYVSDAPAARVLGPAENCVTRSMIRNTRVRDDRTIDFEMTGGRVYRNTLPASCPRLGFEEGFTYRSSSSQLCSVEIIYVLDRTGGDIRRGAGCGLGEFVPIEYVDEDDPGGDPA